MTAAEQQQILNHIEQLVAVRAEYDTIAKNGTSRIFVDNAREQAALITGQISRLRSLLR